VLLLLDLEGLAVLECPLNDVGLGRGALDKLTLLELRPELAEVLELDQVPDIAEGCVDDGRLADGGGSGDGRHCEWVQLVMCGCFGLGVGF
jgi:hypothetical protein